MALGRGDWTVAAGLLGEAFGHGDRMAEVQRLSPPLWGLAERVLIAHLVKLAREQRAIDHGDGRWSA